MHPEMPWHAGADLLNLRLPVPIVFKGARHEGPHGRRSQKVCITLGCSK
ncbi:unnamed protein product, partial [Sphacelaria rigidula]